MEEADVRAPALERHLQGLDGHVPVVHRADGPPHDEPREQIQDRREVQLPLLPMTKLGRVADPPLIRGCLRRLLLVIGRIPLQMRHLRHILGQERRLGHKSLPRKGLAPPTNSEGSKHLRAAA